MHATKQILRISPCALLNIPPTPEISDDHSGLSCVKQMFVIYQIPEVFLTQFKVIHQTRMIFV